MHFWNTPQDTGQYASSQIGAAMLDSQLGRDLWRHARVKREVFREGSAAVIWLV